MYKSTLFSWSLKILWQGSNFLKRRWLLSRLYRIVWGLLHRRHLGLRYVRLIIWLLSVGRWALLKNLYRNRILKTRSHQVVREFSQGPLQKRSELWNVLLPNRKIDLDLLLNSKTRMRWQRRSLLLTTPNNRAHHLPSLTMPKNSKTVDPNQIGVVSKEGTI